MHFNKHYNLEGKHAFLSPSQHSWLRYTPERLQQIYANKQMVERGTRLHQLAHDCIVEGVKLDRKKQTLNMYVNDAISYRMTPQVPLYFSDDCFGTADAISFNEKKKELRIHDLKTGNNPASMEQLEIYAALFCHEYNYKPEDITIQLRIYQFNDIFEESPDPQVISAIMDQIVLECREIEKMRMEE